MNPEEAYQDLEYEEYMWGMYYSAQFQEKEVVVSKHPKGWQNKSHSRVIYKHNQLKIKK